MGDQSSDNLTVSCRPPSYCDSSTEQFMAHLTDPPEVSLPSDMVQTIPPLQALSNTIDSDAPPVHTDVIAAITFSNRRRRHARIYSCSKCSKKFARYSSAKNHCKGFTWACSKCGTEIHTRNNVKRHMKRCDRRLAKSKKVVEPDSRPSICSMCKKEYKNANALRSHMYFMHERPAGEFKCKECDFSCNILHYLKRHITLKHSNSSTFDCTRCAFTCHSENGLNRHTRRVHIPVQDSNDSSSDQNSNNSSSDKSYIDSTDSESE